MGSTLAGLGAWRYLSDGTGSEDDPADGSTTTVEEPPSSPAADVSAEQDAAGTADESSTADTDDHTEATDEPSEDDEREQPTDDGDSDGEYQPPPADTPAGAFLRACDSIERLRSVDTSGPVHVYDGRYTAHSQTARDNDRDAERARVYALAPAHAEDGDAVEAFETAVREWEGISKNTHIATVYDSGDQPQPWVAFDPGMARLDDVLSSLETGARVNAIVHLAEAIRTASMYNFVHGNISPAVAFIGEDLAADPVATLADWGIQRAVDRAVGDPALTPYTAPEQLAGEIAGTETDTYQLGAVAYRLLTGDPPFADANDPRRAIVHGDLTPPTDRNPVLPDEIDDIVADAMATNPGDRLQPYDFRQRLLAAIDE